ncbi:MAG: hypothetical protein PHS66_00845 [Candidatus Omnitrophica bacterium]|nr:hypothetical protein [Candidatus Omnitrophota bacterium]
MDRFLKGFLFTFCFMFFLSTHIFAEDITITTYYPSPYGSYKNLNIYNIDETATQTDFTQGVTKAGLLITTEYVDGAFTPGIFWSTLDNNATKPKAGIYLKETGSGTNMYFGTSNAYATGITNNALIIDPSGNLTGSAGITSSGSSGIGYATGAGGTVTQSTSKSTGVTINKPCGTITMNGAALAAATIVSFTVTNSTVAANDVIVTQHNSVGTIGAYTITANTPAAGSFQISVRNNTAGSLSEAIVIRFAVIKAVTS